MPIQRRKTCAVAIGHVSIGSDFPIIIQSMTNTPTADIKATVDQIKDLVDAGSELVRLTINDDAAAEAVPKIQRLLSDENLSIPLIGDFHFNGHLLLSHHPEMAKLLAKYRINPGNLGRGEAHDKHFETIIKIAVKNNKPVRIGVNSGSLDPELLSDLIARNTETVDTKTEHDFLCESMIQSALQSARKALELGLNENQIILSAKTSDLQDLISIYRGLACQCVFPLHLGLTEAGSQEQGVIASTAAISILLQQGIGDTLRISLTPDQHTPRTKEVLIAQQILQSLGIRYFQPKVVSCPGCGRTSSRLFQHLSQSVKDYVNQRTPEWRKKHPDICRMTIAVMGCIVNGPGESRHADIGISLPGNAEDPTAPVFIKGKLATTLNGNDVEKQFLTLLENFIQTSY
jgi:(E)-4-hydroxy-3-methylbut-2-enyl-diphosphate synthase